MSKEIKNHLKVIFGRLPNTGFINLRGIGEKGTDGEGTFREDRFIDVTGKDIDTICDEIKRNIDRWNEHGRASFIVPAILSEQKGKSENVHSFGSIVVDLDSGNIDEKHKFLEQNVGVPTAVVYSGGEVNGVKKRHLWWTLLSHERDIGRIVKLRDELARKGGGDIQFGLGVPSNPYGRAHQPVRIAGSIHNKGGNAKPVILDMPENPSAYGIDLISDRIMLSPMHDGTVAEVASNNMFHPERGELDLTEDVLEGGEEKTRWSQFSRVAGHYIHCIRQGQMSIDEGKASTHGWMIAHMLPAWPTHRFENEWHAIFQRDLANHGPFPEPAKPMVAEGQGLEVWAAHRWSLGEKPKRKFLVDELILAGKHQLLVAEGGAGKTFMMLDLAIKVASLEEDEELLWCGKQVREGGTVVILTTEDDKDELHIRLADIDPTYRREKAGDKLIILPTINSGGSFAIVEQDPKTGEARPSRKWTEFFALLRRLPNLKLVVVDTLNSTLHGEENSATIINEFVRVASQVCGELGSALILTHHIRKQGPEPIRGIEDMKAAIRGSSALPAAFRAVLGIWHCSDYDRRLQAMHMPPRRGVLWKLGVLKANNPEMMDGELTLLRQDCGILEDITQRDPFSADNSLERHAWLSLAIEVAARLGHPYSLDGKNSKSGLYRRRNELPTALRHVGPNEFAHLVDDLLLRKSLVACAAKGGKDKKWLDLPNGPIASDEAGAELASGAYSPPDWNVWAYDPSLVACVKA